MPGGWATNKQYASVEEARSELALLPEFKSGDLVLREYTILKNTPVRQGTVGELTSANGNKYEGGGIKWSFYSIAELEAIKIGKIIYLSQKNTS